MSGIIREVSALEIINSKRKPTVEVRLTTDDGFTVRGSAPSGTSRGKHEAFELYDGGIRYGGFGVREAVRLVNTEIRDALVGLDVTNQRLIDKTLTRLDGTPNKSRLGGNSILAASIAAAKAGALTVRQSPYRYLGGLGARRLPDIACTVISGGRFSPSGLEFEDYLMILHGLPSFSDSLEALCDIRGRLEKKLNQRFGGVLEDGGALAPPLSSTQEVFELILDTAREAGYESHAELGLDVAANELYCPQRNTYRMMKQELEPEALIDYYEKLSRDYPLRYIEDGFEQDDFVDFHRLKMRLPHIQIVGDDLFATNTERIRMGIEQDSANGLLFKINQIGTVSEAMDAAVYAKEHQYEITASLRSGDTNDEFQADMAVAVGAVRMKLGTPGRGERNAKYNRLLAIEEELGV